MFTYKVDSTSIKAIGYDTSSQVLIVIYVKKGTYKYINVPLIIYQRLAVSKDKQWYIDKSIDGSYIELKIN
ncbi:TPA: KTSC domain-containing protein [Providencia rettgeri]